MNPPAFLHWLKQPLRHHRLLSGDTPSRFGLYPKQLLAVDDTGVRGVWRVRVGWNGRRRLEPCAMMQEPSIMVIANGLPLRRKLQRFPESAQVRRALIASAADEFPFAGDEVDCALGLRGADAYLYALTRARRAILQESLPPVHGLLVASSTDLSIATCLTTLDQFDRFGQVMSLGGAPRYLPRHYLLNVFLGMLLAIQVSLLSYALLSPHWLERHLDQEIAALDRGHGELARLQAVSERMVHAQTAAASLAAAPAARLPALLEQTFATVPEGHGISTLEWKDGVLYLRGSGPDPGPWLRATGFSGDEIVIEEKLGGRLNWRAQKKL